MSYPQQNQQQAQQHAWEPAEETRIKPETTTKRSQANTKNKEFSKLKFTMKILAKTHSSTLISAK